MQIGIIGSGNIGGGLARPLTALGHDVVIANSRGPGSLGELVAETGARAVEIEDVADGAELVVVAIPQKAVPELPDGLLEGHLVLDANNYYPARDGRIDALEAGQPESAWVAEQLGGPTVVKAFNTIRAPHIAEDASPAGTAGRRALPVAGDPGPGKDLVLGLVDALGFDPIDAGALAESWRQQPDTPVYVVRLDAHGVREALAAATKLR